MISYLQWVCPHLTIQSTVHFDSGHSPWQARWEYSTTGNTLTGTTGPRQVIVSHHDDAAGASAQQPLRPRAITVDANHNIRWRRLVAADDGRWRARGHAFLAQHATLGATRRTLLTAPLPQRVLLRHFRNIIDISLIFAFGESPLGGHLAPFEAF